jgi:hypothetical protein
VTSSTIDSNTLQGVGLVTSNTAHVVAGFGGNDISHNGGQGVSLVTDNQSGLVVDFTSNTITSNTANGVLAIHNGGTISGAAVGFVAPGLLITSTGSTVQASFEGNVISSNGARGLDITFSGVANTSGTGYTLTGNTITGNGSDGVFLQTASGLRTNTFVSATETAINSGMFVAPAGTTVIDAGGGFKDWVDATVANDVLFVANSNTIASNGAQGMYIHVGTTGYVHAEVKDNHFAGNVLTDFRTDSFITGGQTPADVVTTARSATVAEVRQITLDNIARLDLRFTGNSGDSISNVSAFGATYLATATSSVKNGNSSTLGGGPVYFNRHLGLFAVEGTVGGILDTSNKFFETNVTQGIPTSTMFVTGDPAAPAFTTGGYDLAPVGVFTPPLPP